MPPRARRLEALAGEPFDLLVIGGGITGCGVARDAALRGLRVALVEKNDFGSGTSSRSSRLVHGGLRYLEHGYLHLVFEASAERRRLLRLAPHLVKPLEFVWPVYTGARVPRWKLGAGLMLYDALSLFRNVGAHRQMSARQIAAREPALRREGLVGGARYFDAATDDARLTLVNALGASEAGAVVVNHAEVCELIVRDGIARGARVTDTLGGRDLIVEARVVVNAAGPWSDDVRRLEGDATAHPGTRGSKGVHIAVPRDRIGNRGALTLLSPRDGRVMFVLPSNGQTIIGTTDTYTASSPDDVRASLSDVAYLLDSANAFFPAAHLTGEDVVSTWAGIRPLLPSSDGDGAEADPGSASREHAIALSPRGVVTITGGKLTTYRVMAAEVVDAAVAQLPSDRRPAGIAGRTPTRDTALPGGDLAYIDSAVDAARGTLGDDGDDALAAHLVHAFGSRWPRVADEIRRDGGAERVVEELPYTLGEMRYAVREEMACTLGDLLVRRTHVAFQTRDHGRAAAPRVVAAVEGVKDFHSREALADYELEVQRMFGLARSSEG